MSKSNAAFAYKEDDEPVARSLPSGAELLIGEIATALDSGKAALEALHAARESSVPGALRDAAKNLHQALKSDPKALARMLVGMMGGQS